eukprot:2968317-Rhodomonas_salina.1
MGGVLWEKARCSSARPSTVSLYVSESLSLRASVLMCVALCLSHSLWEENYGMCYGFLPGYVSVSLCVSVSLRCVPVCRRVSLSVMREGRRPVLWEKVSACNRARPSAVSFIFPCASHAPTQYCSRLRRSAVPECCAVLHPPSTHAVPHPSATQMAPPGQFRTPRPPPKAMSPSTLPDLAYAVRDWHWTRPDSTGHSVSRG